MPKAGNAPARLYPQRRQDPNRTTREVRKEWECDENGACVRKVSRVT